MLITRTSHEQIIRHDIRDTAWWGFLTNGTQQEEMSGIDMCVRLRQGVHEGMMYYGLPDGIEKIWYAAQLAETGSVTNIGQVAYLPWHTSGMLILLQGFDERACLWVIENKQVATVCLDLNNGQCTFNTCHCQHFDASLYIPV